jgi:hypothetical protein
MYRCTTISIFIFIGLGICMTGYGGSITNNNGYKYCPDGYLLCNTEICVNSSSLVTLDVVYATYKSEYYIFVRCTQKWVDTSYVITNIKDTLMPSVEPPPNYEEKMFGYKFVIFGLLSWFLIPCCLCFLSCLIDLRMRKLHRRAERAESEKRRLAEIERNKPRRLMTSLEENPSELCCYCGELLSIGLKTKFICGHCLHTECYNSYNEYGVGIKCPMCRQNLQIIM